MKPTRFFPTPKNEASTISLAPIGSSTSESHNKVVVDFHRDSKDFTSSTKRSPARRGPGASPISSRFSSEVALTTTRSLEGRGPNRGDAADQEALGGDQEQAVSVSLRARPKDVTFPPPWR